MNIAIFNSHTLLASHYETELEIIYNHQELLVNYGNAYRFNEPTSHSTKYISNRQADNIN
jgi:hypothetical protein